MSDIFVGDEGTRIIANCGADVSTSSTRQIKYVKPSGDEGSWSATLGTIAYSSGDIYIPANEWIYYILQTDDIDESGDWQVQVYLVLSAWTGHGKKSTMQVQPALFTV